MRTLTVKRKKHFVGFPDIYKLTVSDALGKRSIKLKNGQTIQFPADEGEVELKVSAETATGYAESNILTVPAGDDMSFKIETGYSVYYGANYTIKRVDNK